MIYLTLIFWRDVSEKSFCIYSNSSLLIYCDHFSETVIVMRFTHCLWLCLLLSTSSLVFGRPLNEQGRTHVCTSRAIGWAQSHSARCCFALLRPVFFLTSKNVHRTVCTFLDVGKKNGIRIHSWSKAGLHCVSKWSLKMYWRDGSLCKISTSLFFFFLSGLEVINKAFYHTGWPWDN